MEPVAKDQKGCYALNFAVFYWLLAGASELRAMICELMESPQSPHSYQSSPNDSDGCIVRSAPLPQANESEGQ